MANVKITSKHSGPILVKIPDLNFRREWMNRGSSVMVDSEKLEEMMYDPGFRVAHRRAGGALRGPAGEGKVFPQRIDRLPPQAPRDGGAFHARLRRERYLYRA